MFEFVAQPSLAVEYAFERGRDHFDRYFTGVAVDACTQDVQILLHFTVMRLANREGGHNVEALPAKRRHHARSEIGPFGKLARLEQRLRAPQQTNTGFKRNPDRQAAAPDLTLPAGKFKIGQLANHDRVVRRGALKVFQTREHRVETE